MFTFANKDYNGIEELCVTKLSVNSGYSVWLDIHGRKIVHYYERYPCFDISDLLYEDRGYHYFYVKLEEEFACLYYDDGLDTISIFDSGNMPVKVFRTILHNELQPGCPEQTQLQNNTEHEKEEIKNDEDSEVAFSEQQSDHLEQTQLPKNTKHRKREESKNNGNAEAALDILIMFALYGILYLIFR